MTHFKVITDALGVEARKWDQLAEQTASPRDYARNAMLAPTAFLLVDPTGLAPLVTWEQQISSWAEAEVYNNARDLQANLLSEAITEFGQIADALIKAVNEYKAADRIFPLALRDIYTA